DIASKKEVVFTSGSVYEAIRASIAIPTVFTPVEREGQLLVDGGVLNNIPVDHVKRSAGDILVVVNVNANIPMPVKTEPDSETEKRDRIYLAKIKEFQNYLKKLLPDSDEESFGYFNLINKTIGTMTNRIAQLVLEKHSPDILINVSRKSCGTYDFYKAEEMIETGQLAASESIRAFKKNSENKST
ncbi:MAG TPA: hypothetical protein DEQ09_04595, partial [Bacteroidales bacterium]|nr:hypothetical protein [Bacteroidales bacterium]